VIPKVIDRNIQKTKIKKEKLLYPGENIFIRRMP